ncbi:MAG: hypothetical protein WBQ76_17495 [Candidatus Korobacteraceae bacterium]
MQPSNGKRPPRPILGVDLDNVLTRTDALIRQPIEEMFGTKLSQSDIKHFDYHLCGVTRDQEREVFGRFHEKECEKVALIEDALAALKTLNHFFDIHIVTGRPSETRRLTIEWLTKNSIPYSELDFRKEKHMSKVHFKAFVEDHREHAYAMARRSVKSFLINYPWNQPNPVDPPNVIRVDTWQEILEELT